MGKIRWIQVNAPEEGATYVYELVKEKLENDELRVIGLATGGTMEPVYEAWVQSPLDFSNTIAFNLDEYVGLDPSSPNSYAYFMNENLFQHKTFLKTYIPNGLADDETEECERYERLLNEHPLDLQLLGVGENGHIAFNEPGTSQDSLTHVASLTPSTLEVNGQYFENREKMPTTAYTMGIRSILNAKQLILLAFGGRKRAAIEKLAEGVIDPNWPITHLLAHPNVIVISDLVEPKR